MDSRRTDDQTRSSVSAHGSRSARNSFRLPGVSISGPLSRTSSVGTRERIELQTDRASTIDTRSITSVYNDWCEADDGQPMHSMVESRSVVEAREETGTLHSVPMITNDEHDYGSRNFNTRDKVSINPRSGRPASRATSDMWSGLWSGLNLTNWARSNQSQTKQNKPQTNTNQRETPYERKTIENKSKENPYGLTPRYEKPRYEQPPPPYHHTNVNRVPQSQPQPPQVNFNLRGNSHHRPNDEEFLLQSGSSFESADSHGMRVYHKGGGQFNGYAHDGVMRTNSQSTDETNPRMARNAPKRMSSRGRCDYREDCEIMSSISGDGHGRSKSMMDLRNAEGQQSWTTTDTGTTGTSNSRSRSTERTASSASKGTISSSSFTGTQTSGTDSAQFFLNSSSNFSSGSSGYQDMGPSKFREQLYARHATMQSERVYSDVDSLRRFDGQVGNAQKPKNNMSNYRGTVRPTNRAVAGEQGPPEGDRVNGSLHNIRDEIASLRSQISRGIESLGTRQPDSSARDMEELADYFSQRLAKCQKQVYNVVNQVQSQVGDMGDSSMQGTSTQQQSQSKFEDPYGHDPYGKAKDFQDGDFDSSDSGIGQPKNGRGTIRPAGRAARRAASSMGGSINGANPYAGNQMNQGAPQQMKDPYGGGRSRVPSQNGGSIRNMDRKGSYAPPPQQQMDFQMNMKPGQPIMGTDGIPRCGQADDVEDFTHFQNFVDDDTPAPEASIPVPRVFKKHQNYIYQVLYAMYCVALCAYIYVRITFTLDAPGLNRIYCTVVACLEIITCPSLLIQGLTLWKWISRPEPSLSAFERPKFHTIRIMVPTYKEPLEVVAGTVHEVVHMDVCPGLNIHVYVLDDGRRENLEQYILGRRTKKYVYLHYVARPKLPGVPHHAKAGNINHTLHYVYDEGRTEGEAVVIFDADFMPRRNYLWRVLPVFSEKRERPIGLVQTPQFFYNVNSDEDVWDHLNVSFFHRIEPSLDQWSAVNCCGTNFTVRADALKDVGYFPVGCLTEDTLLSLRLCTMGWAVSYHHEVLAIGQSPHELTEIFKQRSRWCKGNLQIFLDEFPLMQSGLTMSQRIFYSSCGYNYFCASISIPFFQLVPSWAIFFGLWPVSEIGIEFACSFFVYYCLGNLLLLFPPPGFQVKDMWNGELASTNLWFTYFNGVRRIVGTKIMQGKGELTFKTTKKKAEGEEDDMNAVGFQKEDVRACYMHFIMFFLMLITIVYAIVKAVIAQDVKFYYYYMYMIGMSWALINMVPYLIVVIYCWYRVRIPGLVCACFRNIQLLLRAVCGVLILIQAYTTRNLTEKFICPHEYAAEIGRSPLTMVRTLDDSNGVDVERNAFWLLGVEDDFYTIQQIKQSACEEDSIPVVVFFMHPMTGLDLDEEAAHYMPEERLVEWEEYDEKIEEYGEALQEVPLLLIMEPSLLMHTFNSKTEYHNTEYQINFANRVQSVINMFPRAWVYVDAGNALYLQWAVNMDHIVDVLKQMPTGLRGFTINVGSFVNSTYNLQLATEVHCQTGLNFILDTSRNGGLFSERTLEEINECTYDPPFVAKGSPPGWADGSKNKVNQKTDGVPDMPAPGSEYEYDEYAYDYRRRRSGETMETKSRAKRWSLKDQVAGGAAYDYGAAAGGADAAYAPYGDAGADYGGGDYYSDYYGDYDPSVIECLSNDPSGGHDANCWIKTPGEADGRIYASGTFHECLLEHSIECSDQCPQYVPKVNGEFERPSSCVCD